jgi:hypothetical protein
MRIRHTLAAAALSLACLAGWSTQAFAQHAHADAAKSDLGTTTVAGLKLTASQLGDVKAGQPAVFEVAVEKEQAKPKAVRAWVGVASAEGSVKAKGEAHGDDYDVHVAVPAKLPESSQLWVEVELARGKKEKAGFDLKK